MTRAAAAAPRREAPARAGAEAAVGRREVLAFLAAAAAAIAAAPFAGRLLGRWRLPSSAPRVRIAAVAAVPVGGARLFRWPTADDPAILLRLSETRFVAFSQRCTHLGCPVHPAPDRPELLCPCHAGVFSAEDGRALAGPPRRPLPRIALEVRDGEVWAAGA